VVAHRSKPARRLAALLLLVTLAAGCATTPRAPAVRIDGSSPAAFDASWNALVATLNQEQQAKLNTAVFLIGATKSFNARKQAGDLTGPGPYDTFGPETLRSELDGKTYDEIIKAGAATGTKITGVERHGGGTQRP
jgi:hypothetical protein